MNNNLVARVILKVDQSIRGMTRFNRVFQKFDSIVNKSNTDTIRLTSQLRRLGSEGSKAGNDIAKSLSRSRHELTELSNGLNRVLGLYAAFQGVSAMVSTSDTMTSAQNKLNYLNSELLGESGFTTDASGNKTYSNATLQATQDQLDKMFTSANKVRSGYTDMMANVSKSMTLAPDAFGGNVDNAIRFQEIMAEAYTLGGASAQEMHSSMYQMIQALGSGILAGDELRSVREGAPLAYKEIEKFAQGLYNTTDSLKDMASQGMITSDIVVAAMMQAGGAIDDAFAMTNMTYAQAWTLIKNAATNAFTPIFNQLNEFLNSDQGRDAIEMVISVIEDLAQVISVLITITTTVVGFMAKHWETIKPILYAVGAAILFIVSTLTILKVASFVAAIAMRIPFIGVILLIAVLIGAIWGALSSVQNMASTFAEGIANTMLWLGYFIVAVVILVTAAAAAGLITITAGIYLFVLLAIGILFVLIGWFIKFADQIMGVMYGVGEVFKAIWENLKIAWNNLLVNMKQSFWLWINDLVQNFGLIFDIINAIREAMGKDKLDKNFAIEKANSFDGQIKSYVNVGDAYRTGYDKGSAVGKGIQDKINGWGDKLKNPTDDMKKALELTDVGSGLNNGALGDISDDTSRIADSMELTNEDLEYLRRIAAMEWKKEYTTANITVDMKNYNQVNGENDLDGIVKQLSNKLYEELGEVANGVYA